jgi:hypothetical protein
MEKEHRQVDTQITTVFFNAKMVLLPNNDIDLVARISDIDGCKGGSFR